MMINSDTRQFVRPGAWRVNLPVDKEIRNERAVGGSAITKTTKLIQAIGLRSR